MGSIRPTRPRTGPVASIVWGTRPVSGSPRHRSRSVRPAIPARDPHLPHHRPRSTADRRSCPPLDRSTPPVQRLSLLLTLALGGLGWAAPAPAQVVLPPGFELVDSPGLLKNPTAVVPVPGGGAFVAEKRGTVRWFATDGSLQQPIVVDLQDEVGSFSERGLLGLAVGPNFTPDGGADSWLYLLYTVSGLPGVDASFDFEDYYGWSRLTRYRIQLGLFNTPVVDATSRQVLLGERLPDGRVPNAIASLHNSHSNGSLVFAPDGSLLLTVGEGAHFETFDAGGIDSPGFESFTHPVTGLLGPLTVVQDSGVFRAQDPRSLAGKVLRIDPATGLGLPSNPYFTGDPDDLESRVWGLGLRNPFRAALQPGTGSLDPQLAAPGRLYVADVGTAEYEELNLFDMPGLNGRWPCFEGPDPQFLYSGYQRPGPNPLSLPDCVVPVQGSAIDPVFSWSHQNDALTVPSGLTTNWDGTPLPGQLAVCLGALGFAEGLGFPPLFDGNLFAADFGYGWLSAIELDAQGSPSAVRSFGSGLFSLVDMQPAGDGSGLLLVDYASGLDGRLQTLRYVGEGPSADWTVPSSAAALEWTGSLTVEDSGSSPLGLALDRTWSLTHRVPDQPPVQIATATGAAAQLVYSIPRDESGPSWFELELTVRDTYGQSAHLRRTYLPAGFERDFTGAMDPIGASLQGAGPTPATANPDIEVLRDGRLPDAQLPEPLDSFTTEHPAGPFAEDDLGYATRDGSQVWFRSLEWTAGPTDLNGGWWVAPQVQVRREGSWLPVDDLEVAPPYPDGSSPPALLSTTVWSFEPILGDALRLVGAPAGVQGFSGAAELRVRTVEPPDRTRFDATPLATPIARVLELDPPHPLGIGSLALETLVDGTRPALDSISAWAQFDNEHAGDQGADDWFGLRFDAPVTLDALTFQEGLIQAGGGWFDGAPDLEVQRFEDGPWELRSPTGVLPVYDSDFESASYREFRWEFQAEVLRGVRLRGVPGGSGGFASSAELAASGPGFTLPECGWQKYGEDVELHSLELDSACALQPGLPGRIDIRGAPGPGTGILGIGLSPSELPLIGGQVLLMGLAGLEVQLLPFDALGSASFAFDFPDDGLSVQFPAYLQAGYFDAAFPGGWRLSNGLIATPCVP